MSKVFVFFVLMLSLHSCTTSNKIYSPYKKYPKQLLQQDFTLLQTILEKKHPALYWYTPKDSMDYYFDSIYRSIPDSMTELEFGWKILAPATQKIHCGHTSFGMSRQWVKFIRNKRMPSFPLLMKVWADTMVVTANLNKKDPVIKKGMLITSINGMRNRALVDRLFQYLPQDGYSDNINYTRLSSNFPYYHRNVFGIYKNYRIGYIDTLGQERSLLLPMYNPIQDSLKKPLALKPEPKPRKVTRKLKREYARYLTVDSNNLTATMVLNTFSKGEGRRLRSFIKQSFRKLSDKKVQHFIIDLRSNGGGDVSMYVLLTKYLINTRFKVADTSYAMAKSLRPYGRHIRQNLLYNVGLLFSTKKQQDGLYHFGYWERHLFRPRQRNHFNGSVYVLINGSTFSASTLFCNAVKGQANVTLVGEETGGGWHGNSGIMIPDIILPNTRLTVRLPLFKLVQYNHVVKNGRGIMPDVLIPPTLQGVREGADRKMEAIREMIKTAEAVKN